MVDYLPEGHRDVRKRAPPTPPAAADSIDVEVGRHTSPVGLRYLCSSYHANLITTRTVEEKNRAKIGRRVGQGRQHKERKYLDMGKAAHNRGNVGKGRRHTGTLRGVRDAKR